MELHQRAVRAIEHQRCGGGCAFRGKWHADGGGDVLVGGDADGGADDGFGEGHWGRELLRGVCDEVGSKGWVRKEFGGRLPFFFPFLMPTVCEVSRLGEVSSMSLFFLVFRTGGGVRVIFFFFFFVLFMSGEGWFGVPLFRMPSR